ncbi:tyrosine-protein kinase [Mucilaginibacter gynuensis]|uniref:non-specific protein-tyrosine kinase n=1 Tax=Mucilaginibacter gynuensis TaxID=1302236 RepID=A0ABP8G3F0_9SPHI
MSKQSNQDFFGSSKVAEAKSFNIREFLNKLLYHWPLYIIFCVICFSIAAFYVRYKRPVYEIHAKLLIKDNQSEGKKTALEELNLTGSTNNLEAEMGLMSSIPVTKRVVESLKLWVSYFEPTKYYSYRDLYKDSPVDFSMIKPGEGQLDHVFDIIIADDKSFLIKQSGDKTTRFNFSNNIKTSFGVWRLDKTESFANYIGRTIRIKLVDPDEVVKWYQYQIHETPIPKSTNVDVSMDDEVPQRGRDIVDNLLISYMDASVQEKRESTHNTLKFVDQRLASLTGELNNVERKYEGFKSNQGITEIADQSSLFQGNAQDNQKNLNAINIQLSLIDGIEAYVNSDEGAMSAPSTIGLDNSGLTSLVEKLTALQLEHTKLLATLPETNPLFNPLNQQISSTRNALKQNLKSFKSGLQTTKRSLQNLGSGYQSSIRNIPGQERELVDIKRMQGIKENLYVYLLQKKEELSLDYASTISDAVIIDYAHNGNQKAPIPKSVYGIALMFGLLIPTALIYGRDAFKNRIQSKNSIISATGLNVLSEIVHSDDPDPIVVLHQKTFIGEQFRDLRTKLNYLHGGRSDGRTTLFTSSIAGEGKSFILSNLGTVLSVAGKKTVLLELDLRRPTFATRFKLDDKRPGLTEYLIGNATKSEVIQPSGISENLFVIPAGIIPPNPSELLESTELVQLITELKKEYANVLIDTPPVHLLTDAMIIAHLCDVSMYVIRQDYTPKHELEFIKELNAEKKLPRLNLIFNGVQSDKTGSNYGYQNNSYIKEARKPFKSRLKKFFSRF